MTFRKKVYFCNSSPVYYRMIVLVQSSFHTTWANLFEMELELNSLVYFHLNLVDLNGNKLEHKLDLEDMKRTVVTISCTIFPVHFTLKVLIVFCLVQSKFLTWCVDYNNFWYFTRNHYGISDLGLTLPHFGSFQLAKSEVTFRSSQWFSEFFRFMLS